MEKLFSRKLYRLCYFRSKATKQGKPNHCEFENVGFNFSWTDLTISVLLGIPSFENWQKDKNISLLALISWRNAVHFYADGQIYALTE